MKITNITGFPLIAGIRLRFTSEWADRDPVMHYANRTVRTIASARSAAIWRCRCGTKLAQMLVWLTLPGAVLADSQVDLGRGPVTIHVPLNYDPGSPTPLALFLHRFGGSGTEVEAFFDFETLAEAHGIIYATPEGTTGQGNNLFWNATDACCDFLGSGVDDSAYLRSLIEAIVAAYNIDAQRVYVAGLSNGGFMAHRMACDHPDLIAAIVAVAGHTFDDPDDCSPSEPVHVLQIHGTADGVIDYTGGNLGTGPYPGAIESVETWAQLNSCDTNPEFPSTSLNLDSSIFGFETTIRRFATDCRSGGSAELWTVAQGLHILTPSPDFGPAVVEFLLDHPKPLRRYLVSSHNQDSLREYDKDGGYLQDFVEPLAGGLIEPQQMAFGPDGHLYVSSFNGDKVYRFHGATGSPLGVAAETFALERPTHLSFDPDGSIVVSWFGSGRVVRHDPEINMVLGNVIDPSAATNVHGRLEYTFGGTDYILVADWAQDSVQRFFDDGVKESDFVTSADGLDTPASIALDPSGEAFWVSNFGSGTVMRFSLETGAPIPPHITGLTAPDGLLVDIDDTLLVCDWGADEVGRYDMGTGNKIEVFADAADGLQQPNGIIQKAVDPGAIPPLPGDDTCIGGANTGNLCTSSSDCQDGACSLKNRYVSFAPARTGAYDFAYRLEVSASPNFPGTVGNIYWVGDPVERVDIPSGDTYFTGELQCEVSGIRNWRNEPLVHILGEAIVPGAVYSVRSATQSCIDSGASLDCLSEPLLIETAKWGDVVPSFGGQSQPNFGDVTALVDKFKELSIAPDILHTDLIPAVPDQITNFGDITAAVDAFKGMPYAGSIASCP